MINKILPPRLALLLSTLHLCPIYAQDAAQPAPPPEYGAIRGWVKDNKDRPLADAKVLAASPLVSPSTVEGRATTDAQGYFDLQYVRPGQHWMIVTKETAGYPDTRWALMSIGAPVPMEVHVLPGQTLGPITINVGVPRGRLVCRVISAVTGAPVQVTYKLTVSSGVDLAQGTYPDGIINTPVPPVPVTMEITDQAGESYLPVRIPNILIPLEQVKEMTITLTPKAPKKP